VFDGLYLAKSTNQVDDANPSSAFFRLLTVTLYILVLLGVFWITLQQVESYDLWFHLATGRWIVEHGRVPRTDPFSFTAPGPWQAHEWLSEWVFIRVFDCCGLLGLVIVKAFILAVAFSLLFRLVARPSRFPIFSALLVAVGLTASWGSLDVRPEAFSLLLFVVCAWIWRDLVEHRGQSRLLLLLPPIIVPWVNLHGGFVAGLAVFGVGLAVEWMRKLFGRDECWEYRSLGKTTATWLLSIVSALVNPYSFRALTYPFEYLVGSHQYATTRVIEWLPPELSRLPGIAFLALCFMLVALILIHRRRLPWSSVSIVVLFGIAAALHRRHIPFFVIVALPLIAALLSTSCRGSALEILLHPRLRLIAGILVWTACVFGVVWKSDVRTRLLSNPLRDDLYPVAAVQFLQQNELPSHVFCQYRHGGFLIWNLFPRYRVFVDGRADVYGEQLLREYDAIITGESGWDRLLTLRGACLALIPRDEKLTPKIEDDGHWERVYRDAATDVYIRSCEESGAALFKWRRDELVYPRDADAYFYRGLSCSERNLYGRAEQHWKTCLEIDPHHADAYANLGTIEARRGRLDEALRLWMKSIDLSNYEDPEIRINIGKALDQQGEHEKARHWYREALRIDPSLSESQQRLDGHQ